MESTGKTAMIEKFDHCATVHVPHFLVGSKAVTLCTCVSGVRWLRCCKLIPYRPYVADYIEWQSS